MSAHAHFVPRLIGRGAMAAPPAADDGREESLPPFGDDYWTDAVTRARVEKIVAEGLQVTRRKELPGATRAPCLPRVARRRHHADWRSSGALALQGCPTDIRLALPQTVGNIAPGMHAPCGTLSLRSLREDGADVPLAELYARDAAAGKLSVLNFGSYT